MTNITLEEMGLQPRKGNVGTEHCYSVRAGWVAGIVG
jgi:hypothetical protein